MHQDELDSETETVCEEFGLDPIWCEAAAETVETDWEERTEILLINLASIAGRPGREIPLSDAEDYPLGHCEGPDEVRFIFRDLKNSGWVDDGIRTTVDYALSGCQLTLQGWKYAQQLPELQRDRRRQRELSRVEKLRFSVLHHLDDCRQRGEKKPLQVEVRKALAIEPMDWEGVHRWLNAEGLVKFRGEFMWLEHNGDLAIEAKLRESLGVSTGLGSGTTARLNHGKSVIVMGDQYNANQAGAMGPGAHAHDMSFTQVWQQAEGTVNLAVLAQELSVLRPQLRREATETEHDIAIADVASAEKAASEGNGPKVMQHLAAAGTWVLDIAAKAGIPVAMEMIKRALGIGEPG